MLITIPQVIQHDWQFLRAHAGGSHVAQDTYICLSFKRWTPDLLAAAEVCPAKDRRKKLPDRRERA